MDLSRIQRGLPALFAATALFALGCNTGPADEGEEGFEAQEQVGEGSAALGNPSWTEAASMATGRYSHAALRLASGEILVAAGYNEAGFVSTAESYSGSTHAWSAAGSLAEGRHDPSLVSLPGGRAPCHRASLLPQGKVLVVGGENQDGSLASAEVWDPATNAWTTVASMSVPRYFPSIIRSGSSLLLAGGRTNDEYTATTELYDPATDTWTAGPDMGTGRYFHTAIELPAAGGILVAGGWNGVATQSSSEIY